MVARNSLFLWSVSWFWPCEICVRLFEFWHSKDASVCLALRISEPVFSIPCLKGGTQNENGGFGNISWRNFVDKFPWTRRLAYTPSPSSKNSASKIVRGRVISCHPCVVSSPVWYGMPSYHPCVVLSPVWYDVSSNHPRHTACCLITHVKRRVILSPAWYGVLSYHPCDKVCYLITRVIRCVVLSPVW